MDTRKAISPILATVILIAVTLVIAIGVIGWIMGIWGSLGGPSESLVVTGGGTAVVREDTYVLRFNLTIVNRGSAIATLSRIEVPGVGSVSTGATSGSDSSGVGCNYTSSKWVSCSDVKIEPGKSALINVSISVPGTFTCVGGATYNVNVYTQAGNVYTTVVRVVDCRK